MGFWAAACMVTELDLREAETYLVPLLEEPDRGLRPFALPILGSYDYYGGIDGPTYELIDLLDQFAAHSVRSGRLVVDPPTMITPDSSLMEIAAENHLSLEFNRRHVCRLDGRGLAYALIARGAWDATVEIGRQLPNARAVDTTYLNEIYGARLADWRPQLDALTAVNAALPVLNRRWHWPESIDEDSTIARLTTARTAFPGDANYQHFLDNYERALED